MALKSAMVLCGALAMLALAWAPVAYVVYGGQGQSARERVASIVDRAAARAAIMPAFDSGGAAFPDLRTLSSLAAEPVGKAGSGGEKTGTEPDAGRGRPESTNSFRVPVRRSASLPLSERPYANLVQQAAERHGVDPHLVHALIEVESSYRADVVSAAGAMGLMQLMPVTAKHYGVVDPLDPESNIDAGTRHLRALLDEFGPIFALDALAAYNAGQSVVRRHGGVPPYPQTHRFVRRVLDLFVNHAGWSGD